MKRILVVGGGITGLSLAYTVARQSECTLVEEDGRLGGKILTVKDGPFTLETGPDSFLTMKPAGWKLCEELGLGGQLVEQRPEFNRTYVVKNRELHVMPGGLTSFVPTRWGPFVKTRLLSWPAKMRMGLEPFIGRGTNPDPSMADFFTRRLGPEAYSWLVEPLLAGIYAGRGNALGLGSTFPRFLELERKHGSLMKASLAARREGAPSAAHGGASRGMFQTLAGGLVQLIEALHEAIRPYGKVRTQVRVDSLALGTDAVRASLSDGTTWEGDHVALCVPSYAAASLLGPLDAPLSRLLDGIPCSSTVTVSLAMRADELPHPLDGYGFVVPRAEGRSTLACTWTSQKWPHRAPSDWRLVRSYLGGTGREAVVDLADEILLEEAISDLSILLGGPVRPHHTWIHRWHRGLPQYAPGHAERVKEIERRLDGFRGRIVVAGAPYRGVGIPDCIADGKAVGTRLLAQ
jgi:oxygen-dependent protoporphyrinogen oxidase